MHSRSYEHYGFDVDSLVAENEREMNSLSLQCASNDEAEAHRIIQVLDADNIFGSMPNLKEADSSGNII
jgi:hypothetical protein